MPTQKMTSRMLKGSADITLTTDLQAYKVLLAVPDLTIACRTWLIGKVIECKDELKAAKLLKTDRIWEGLPKATTTRLKRELSALLASKKATPAQLVEALKANPQGEARDKLLDLICEKAASADGALQLTNVLSLEERVRLAKRALVPRVHDYRPARALRFLNAHKDWPPEMRTLFLESLFQGYAGAWRVRDLFQELDWYFPDSSPMTPEERELVFSSMLTDRHARLCVDLLANYGRGSPYEWMQLSREEATRVVVPALRVLSLETRVNSDMERILKNQASLALFTPEQEKELRDDYKKAA